MEEEFPHHHHIGKTILLSKKIKAETETTFRPTKPLKIANQPQISIRSLKNMAQMIKWPFAPIGMLIDNALSQKANKVLIDLKTLEIKQDNLEYLLLGKT